MDTNSSFKRNALLLGGVIGAVVGVLAANMLVKEAEEGDGENSLTPAKGFQLGMLVLGLLRQITNL
jgi:gas vesicle protein